MLLHWKTCQDNSQFWRRLLHCPGSHNAIHVDFNLTLKIPAIITNWLCSNTSLFICLKTWSLKQSNFHMLLKCWCATCSFWSCFTLQPSVPGRRGPQWAENQAMEAHGLQAQWTKTYPQIIVMAKPHSQKLQWGCNMTISFWEDFHRFSCK